MKNLSLEELQNLNQLLDESLQQASKEQLVTCIKLLGTSLAHIKIQHRIDDDKNAQQLSHMVSELERMGMEQQPFETNLNELASKTIVECATAMAIVKKQS